MLTRFAPAPTGYLHLGHVLNAEHVWTSGARVLLRIEDHDRERSRPEYEAAILEDLDWLGYRADVSGGRQSDRDEVYREAIELLRARGLVYACDCTRKEIAARDRTRGYVTATSSASGIDTAFDIRHSPLGVDQAFDIRHSALTQPASTGDELWYPGHCRDRGLPLVEGYGWRVRIDPGVERFVDGRLGLQEQDPSRQCGDFLLRDRRGNWTYQFAVTVDDWRQEIDLVIRGEDLLASTGRQIQLARLLGRERPPAFLHHRLIMETPTQKLSKSDGATGVREMRARGWTPDRVKAAAREA